VSETVARRVHSNGGIYCFAGAGEDCGLTL